MIRSSGSLLFAKAVIVAASKNSHLKRAKVTVMTTMNVTKMVEIFEASKTSVTELSLVQSLQVEEISPLAMRKFAEKIQGFQELVTLTTRGLSDPFLLAIISQLSTSESTKLKKRVILGSRGDQEYMRVISPMHNSLLGLGEFLASVGASALKELELGGISLESSTMEGLICGLSQYAKVKPLTFRHNVRVSPEAAGILATSICNVCLESLTLAGGTTIGDGQCHVFLHRSLRFDTTLLLSWRFAQTYSRMEALAL